MYAGASSNWPDFLSGSMSVVASASVVYDDEVILEDLDIVEGSITKESDGRQIQQRLQLTTVDETGAMLAGPTAPLIPFGQTIRVRAGLADKAESYAAAELLPMGEFGIDSPDGQQSPPWRLYPNGAWLVSGGMITANASDALAQVAREEFETPQRATTGATVRSETERILLDRMPVASWDPVWPSTAVARDFTYSESRLTTLLDLAALLGAVGWADRDGAYNLLSPVRKTSGVWRLTVGNPQDPDDRGALVSWVPDLTRDGISNAVIITSEDTNGNELRGLAYETSGPLAYGGPFGRVPLKEENRRLRSNAACKAFAASRLATMISSRSITVSVQCLPNFALDPLDTIEMVVPNRSIMGVITSITYPLRQATMEMQVAIPLADWVIA